MVLLFQAVAMHVPASQLVGPLAFTTISGIVLTVIGLAAKGRLGFFKSGAMAMVGSVLGILGLADLATSNQSYQFIQGVCDYSKWFPLGSSASWACPQVQASYEILWISGVSLLVPVLLFLVVPSVTYLQKRPSGSDVSGSRLE